jgi:hypothetical protein
VQPQSSQPTFFALLNEAGLTLAQFKQRFFLPLSLQVTAFWQALLFLHASTVTALHAPSTFNRVKFDDQLQHLAVMTYEQ